MILHAQTSFVQRDVKRPLLSVGKLTQSGTEVKFGDTNSWIDLQTDTGVQRVPVQVKGKTFGLSIQKTDAWIIPETSDPAPAAPEAAAAPRPEETQDMRQTGRERDSWDNPSAREDSRVAGNWLSALGAPLWGTKAQMFPRLVHAEARRELQKRDEAWLADRARELAEAGGQGELRVPTAPEEPSAEDRARHEVTDLPYQRWCAWCVMGKGRAKPHLQRPVESVKVPEFEMDFCSKTPNEDMSLVIRHGPRLS